ncbi:MAG: YcxB-like protein [Acidobacteria bacterium]|jgi:hypothetical protein|nr:YcxB-like protein [Acidobacteriota bacterium]
MINQIEAKISYTPDDFVRNIKYIQSRRFLYKYSIFAPVLVTVCMLLYVYVLDPVKFTANLMQPEKSVVFIVPTLLMGFWWLARKYSPNFLLKRQIESQFKSSPVLSEIQFISFDEKGFYAANQFGSGQTNWQAIIEATETEDDFFFFTTKQFAQFFPKRCFTEEQINQIRQLATRKLGEKANLLQ